MNPLTLQALIPGHTIVMVFDTYSIERHSDGKLIARGSWFDIINAAIRINTQEQADVDRRRRALLDMVATERDATDRVVDAWSRGESGQ